MAVRGSSATSLSLSETRAQQAKLLLFLKELFAQIFIGRTVFTVSEKQKNRGGLQNHHWISSTAYSMVLKLNLPEHVPFLPEFILLKRNCFIKKWRVTFFFFF